MTPRLIPALLCLLLAGPAAANESAAHQFEYNAKLAGRALACGDKAGHAALRAVSRRLAGMLEGDRTPRQRMASFDARAGRQQRFSSGVKAGGSACRRNSENLRDSLDRTTHLIDLH